MKTLKQSVRLFVRNFRSILIFELAYRLICTAILLPLLAGAFHLSLSLAGFRYLSADRLSAYLRTPSTVFILLLLLLSVSVITVFEVFCILPALHASFQNRRISVTEMFSFGLSFIRKSFAGKNMTIFLFTLALIPVANLTVLSGYVSSITIPDVLLYYIRSQKWLFRVLMALFAVLSLLALRFSFSLHIFCLEKRTYREARKKSAELLKGSYLRTLFLLFLWNMLLLLLIVFACGLGLLLSGLALKLFRPTLLNGATLLLILKSLLTVLFDLYAFFVVPLTFSLLSALFYEKAENIQADDTSALLQDALRPRVLRNRKLALSIVLTAALFNLLYLKIATQTDVFWNQSILGEPTITAHRGDKSHAPENSLAAFEAAIENHADIIELDVQQTKDGVVVVVHDFNLKHLAGLSRNVWELDYAELAKLDIGSSYRADYPFTPIPTFADALELCRGKADLNIELKQSAHSENLEDEVVRLIEEADYAEHCTIASKDLATLEKVKQMNEELKTLYLLPLAYGNYREMDFVDGFSIKSSFVTKKLVDHIHDSGKFVCAWTVNSESEMERMYSLGIDSLITDNPLKAAAVFSKQSLNPTITTWLKQMADSFR